MLRLILAAIAGLFIGSVVMTLGHAVTGSIWSVTPTDEPAEMAAQIAALPITAKLAVLLTYAVSAFVAGFVAATIRPERALLLALAVGAFFTVSNVVNELSVSAGLWFAVVSTVLFLPMTWVGARAGRTVKEAAMEEPAMEEPG